MSHDWYIKSATITEDGETMEVSFKSKNSIASHTITMDAINWLHGTWAEFKLAEIEASLQKTFEILQGRR